MADGLRMVPYRIDNVAGRYLHREPISAFLQLPLISYSQKSQAELKDFLLVYNEIKARRNGVARTLFVINTRNRRKKES
jgi:hypothetical protein